MTGVLFTAGGLISQGLEPTARFKNSRPQRYYATVIQSYIREKLKEDTKNVPIRTTVPSHSRDPFSNYLDQEKAANFQEVLLKLPWRPLNIHKIQVELIIDKECYQLIERIPYKGNAGHSSTSSQAGAELTSLTEPIDNPFRI